MVFFNVNEHENWTWGKYSSLLSRRIKMLSLHHTKNAYNQKNWENEITKTICIFANKLTAKPEVRV